MLIERKFKKIYGVESVVVSQTKNCAEIICTQEPHISQLDNAVKEHGYRVYNWGDGSTEIQLSSKRNLFEAGAIFLILLGAYLILKQFNFIPNIGISENMSLGVVFVIGLIAATSTCIAVTGGLLLAVAAKYNEKNPDLTGVQRFRPHIYFNAGRIVSYTVLGAATGALGSFLTISAKATGILTILASIIMIALGFQLLKIFPGAKRLQLKMPKFIQHKIHNLSSSNSKFASFVLGGFTFFLPCGFTQALQLYVLSRGDYKTGALTMLVFSLGTLPALLSLSAISSFSKGKFQRYFLKFSGVLVVMLGVFNINNGLTLAGSNFNFSSIFQKDITPISQVADPNVEIINGKQIVKMKVDYIDYIPMQFTVYKGIPVEWQVDGRNAAGCVQVLTVPKLGITEYLPKDSIKTITFTPQEVGEIKFRCSMGMTDPRAKFTVIENPNTGSLPIKKGGQPEKQPTENTPACNPEIQNCLEAQKVSLEVSRERGVYPQLLTVKKGIPVDLTINNKVQLGGCMSVWVIPKYNVTIPMKVGAIKTTFTPTETGTIALTCSMGSLMARFSIIN